MKTFSTKLTKFAMSVSMILTAISITQDQLVQTKTQSTRWEIHLYQHFLILDSKIMSETLEELLMELSKEQNAHVQ